jgi:hypothetical protein
VYALPWRLFYMYYFILLWDHCCKGFTNFTLWGQKTRIYDSLSM